MLNTKLSPNLKYHSLEHTLYVLNAAETIAKESRLNEEELYMLKVAVLYHDIGFIHVYKNHEEEGCKIAKEQLVNFGFTQSEIEQICGMIMATKIPQSPKTKLEEVIADADLEYLGTPLFKQIGQTLFEELKIINPSLTVSEWNQMQISFLEKHHYFTPFCKEHREWKKKENIEVLKMEAK
jgi:predicted metal-dependent HD superfamily phosphohydrolase